MKISEFIEKNPIAKFASIFVVSFSSAVITAHLTKKYQELSLPILELVAFYLVFLMVAKIVLKYSKYNLNKNAVRIPLFILVIFLISLKAYFDYKERQKNLNLSMEEKIRIAGVEINKRLPMKIDNATTLEKITTEDRNLTYHYIINLAATGPNPDKNRIINFVLPNILKSQCGTLETREQISKDHVSYTYLYQLSNQTSFVEIKLDDELCKKYGY